MFLLDVGVNVDAVYTNTAPAIRIFSSIDFKEFEVVESTEIQCQLNFSHNCQIGVEFLNKDDVDDNWIEIKSIKIDTINLQHFIFKGKFYPTYNKNWYESQLETPPNFYCPGTQMRHNGIWVLPIAVPVFKTILNQWLYDNR